ncbi:MAG: 3'-5' exonuclease [Desulfitobacterium hafniense]|uniref:3'-5' exonuclease n=1 Tax=Desulfitobacterium hafniense TaxID=49338 RepID=UPI002B21A1F2|nr:3'-5' exonuclease [Desulfitobacterium hafniense]MEA5024288.1 3'-5' exonuclease [Desulfitobacterium hafniense]
MKPITFIDTEIEPRSKKILDIGGIKGDGSTFHSASVPDFTAFLRGSEYLGGHNIFHHDLKYLDNTLQAAGLHTAKVIDTLWLSPLLFPARPYHALLKDDKLQTEEANNPLNDAIKARDLFFDEVTAFQQADPLLKVIFHSLLKGQKEFSAFFHYMGYQGSSLFPEKLIRDKFQGRICAQADLTGLIAHYPVELAYCLALLNTNDRYAITPPWVLKHYPSTERIMYLLRNNPCLEGCVYCHEALDIHKGLKRFFGFDSYRTYGGEPLQEKAVQAAVDNKSLLAVFPTGGGKSITFQIPALISGAAAKGLTVVISPLQSLMKDQVDNLERAGITEAVTINGLLDPIERAKSYERVENGSASLLYISPESLRSKTIESLLLNRNVVRFVIDEAHCFSAWGIYEFRGASSEYMVNLILEKQATLYELVENYRSKSNLVQFSNQFAARIPLRLKDTPIIPKQTDLGKIKLVRYHSNHLLTPLVEDMLREGPTGTTCVLTKTNEEALQITGLLVKNSLQAKLIQSNDGFNLYNLWEVRFFLSSLGLTEGVFTISPEAWTGAKGKLKEKFARSLNYEVCLSLLKEFEAACPDTKYTSDLEMFIRESKLEDFLGGDRETIFVSTIHKAKGREFDNVYLLLEHFSLETEEAVRQLYVGMTRAKRNLMIHCNDSYLDGISAEGLERLEDEEDYLPPRLLALQLTFRDVWLDFFLYPQHWQRIGLLNSGDELVFDGEGCRNPAGQLVLKFSQRFKDQLESVWQKGYVPGKARIRFIVYWQKEGTEREVRIVLPELYLEKK